ncbi:DNA topoisomerase I (macronuclear) [Tetrahymena thermophila SB210]|uniref:DNA topoisomerase n=1 Tax=Tetrahymena thermophila (strain SB210) TaxID=312017 RepID=I7M423_TETTS|nr:DNA topoisomerase I [Tetrahymena thermophila SB210]EAS04755.2 DNA topoisomerase I [Tetrahymena thermophila SB210]|eukprot:XP_001025000.2 DNA topoisomerase I [Tetrahymena thermophila SB210]
MEQDFQGKFNRSFNMQQDQFKAQHSFIQDKQNQGQKSTFQYTQNAQQKFQHNPRFNKFDHEADQSSYSLKQFDRAQSYGKNYGKDRNMHIEKDGSDLQEQSTGAAPLRKGSLNQYQKDQSSFQGKFNQRKDSNNEQFQSLRGLSQDDSKVPAKTGYLGKNFDPNYKNRLAKQREGSLENQEDGEIKANSNPLRQPRNNSSSFQGSSGSVHQPPRQQNQPYFSNVHAKGLLPYSVDEGFDSFVTVLMVAEKPSIARSIAEALGGAGFTTRKGICKFSNVFTFYGHIFGKKALIKVTSVIGHIYTSDFTQEYQDWRRVDPYKLFNATTLKKETNPNSQIIQHLQKEAMGASYLILWLDNDREGENICFEVLTICKPELIKEDFQQIFRAKFSSITPIDIRKAFDELSIGPNFNESQAVDARQIIDLKVGVAFSRFQTRYLVRKYEDLNNKKITFGPCQTPTLSFCVQRDDEIKDFISKPFYRIIPKISLVPNELINLEWTKERTYDQQEALDVKQELESIGQTSVVKVDNKETQKIKPVALNTVNFLKMASKQYGLGPQNAMQVAEKLYLGGFITYPRTESTKYPDKFDFNSVLHAVCQYHQNQNISIYAQKLQQNGIHKSRLGKDVGDHPPITPTNKIMRQQLSRDEQNIYELVCRHFLATVSSDCRLYKKKVLFQTGNQTFSLIGTAVIDKGYLEALPWQKIYENEIPNFSEGDQIYLHSVDIHSGKTQPPDHLTESDLISLMEQNGIGTDASMAQHIQNICDREYVQVVGQARRLVPTELGSSLIHAYAEIDPELVAPNLRSSIERSVDLISQGELDKDQVLQSVIELFKNKYLYFVSKVGVLDKYFDPIYQSIETTISQAQYFTKCGRCKCNMKILDKIGKIFCERCKFMYGLPRDSKYSIAGECFCPIDGFQLVLIESTVKGNTKRFTICPLCFQKTPELENYSSEEKYQRTSCNLCSNRSCQFSMVNNEIGPCPHCKYEKGGRLVLDWPDNNNYTMTCNACMYQYLIVKNGKLIRSQMKCANCNCFQVKIETSDGFSALGCLFCDIQTKNRMEERPPTEPQGESSLRNQRYFNEDLDKSIEDQPLKLKQPQALQINNNQKVIGLKNNIMEIENQITEADQPIKKRRGRPPKAATEFNFQEKENIQDEANTKPQTRKPRATKAIKKLSQEEGEADEDEEQFSKPTHPTVDFVKKGIQKAPKSYGNTFNQFKAQQQQKIDNQFQNSNFEDILEDSHKQDLEFFSKFPRNNIIKENQETYEILKESTMLLSEIDGHSTFKNYSSLENSFQQNNRKPRQMNNFKQNQFNNQQFQGNSFKQNISTNSSIQQNNFQQQRKPNYEKEMNNSFQNKNNSALDSSSILLKQLDF